MTERRVVRMTGRPLADVVIDAVFTMIMTIATVFAFSYAMEGGAVIVVLFWIIATLVSTAGMALYAHDTVMVTRDWLRQRRTRA